MTTQLRRRTGAVLGGVTLAVLPLTVTTTSSSAAPTPIPVGRPPVAVITVPSQIYAGIPVTLSGADSSTPTGGISEWEWDLDGNGTYEHDSTSSSWISESFTRGKHTVKLRVRNTSGLVGTASKTLTVLRAPSAAGEPGPPAAVTATAKRTSVEVTWTEPADALTAPPLAYRVSNGGDQDTDPIYVSADDPLSATFDDLVPGDYDIRVAAVNGNGTGPSAGASVQVLAKGATASAPPTTSTPTGASTPTATANGVDPAATTTAAASSSTGGVDRDTIGIALITAGGVVLLGAAVTAGVSMWRRRHAEPSA